MKIIQPTPDEREILMKNGVIPDINEIDEGADYGLKSSERLKEKFDTLQMDLLKEKDPIEKNRIEREIHETAIKLGLEKAPNMAA